MDVDCDGIDYQCKNNPDGQNVTDWGALSAYAVPWVVIPYSFISHPPQRKQLAGNNLAVVICDGQMFYAIFGDSNGDDPEVIGEASWLLARTCFPEENLDGGNGHGKADVTYIVFGGDDAVVPDVGWSYVGDFGALRALGDSLVMKLVANLGFG
ncbi:Chitosanase-domain-containing protein [Clavulina sp. PMI_390]|nr:Chitosanase-domain-containing protein [Clavulina sp. PMI_390]